MCCDFPLSLSNQQKIGRLDFDTRRVPVMPHADLAHTQLSQITFRAIDLIQRLQSYRRAMRNTRRQTSERRFVPCRQSHFARQLADFRLFQTGINQGRDHAMLHRRGAAGPPIEQIILI